MREKKKKQRMKNEVKYHFRIVLSRERFGNRAAKLQIYVYARFGGGRRRDRRVREEKRTEAEVNKTKVEEGTVDRWRDGNQPRDGTRLRVCDDGRQRELFEEATCARETRELVCRLATDKSVARAFFNCVSLTPDLVQPPCLGWRHFPRGPIISSSFSSFPSFRPS